VAIDRKSFWLKPTAPRFEIYPAVSKRTSNSAVGCPDVSFSILGQESSVAMDIDRTHSAYLAVVANGDEYEAEHQELPGKPPILHR
jgi:hypothetical protein